MKRRDVLKGLGTIPVVAGSLNCFASATGLPATESTATNRESGQKRLRKPLLNHVGFRPTDPKHVVVAGAETGQSFQIYQVRTKAIPPRFTGKLLPAGGDFGPYRIGDFSAVKEPGFYRVSVPGIALKGEVLDNWSDDFEIGDRVWDGPVAKLVNYYRKQSCGASAHGYATPCHVGPIGRTDGGPARPILGGWHSAEDAPRDLVEVLHGIFGLLALANRRPDLARDIDIFKEIRWGNDYFLDIQDPAGYCYFGVYPKDYFSDFDIWDSSKYVLRTEPAALYCQHQFIAAQAMIADIFRGEHPEYAARCIAAATRCFDYCRKHAIGDFGDVPLSYGLGTGAFAAAHMFRATGDAQYSQIGREFANKLTALQHPSGYWPEQSGPEIPLNSDYNLTNARYLYGPYAPLGLVTAAQVFMSAEEHPAWTAALQRYAASCFKHFGESNAFGIMPTIITRAPQDGGREWNGLRYRYFISGSQGLLCPGTKVFAPWRTGNVSTVAGYGLTMLALSRMFRDQELRALAQRQLDWIAGSNPVDASLIVGVGRNQPARYPSREMDPAVPDIEGAVFEGFIGDDDDMPLLLSGYYSCCEYWDAPSFMGTVVDVGTVGV